MTDLKREAVKMIRDFIKKNYKTRDCCCICSSKDNLELHHLYSVSELFNTWLTKNKVQLDNTVEQMLKLRIIFAADCEELLSNSNLYTLCSTHHKRLHNIYGQTYPNSMAPKIKNWISIQKEKHGN